MKMLLIVDAEPAENDRMYIDLGRGLRGIVDTTDIGFNVLPAQKIAIGSLENWYFPDGGFVVTAEQVTDLLTMSPCRLCKQNTQDRPCIDDLDDCHFTFDPGKLEDFLCTK